MRQLLLLTAAVLPMLAFAVPARAELSDDYMQACMRATQNNETLCTCKTEQATSLGDEEMLKFLVAQLRSPIQFNAAVAEGAVPEEIMKRWPFHVRDTGRICTRS